VLVGAKELLKMAMGVYYAVFKKDQSLPNDWKAFVLSSPLLPFLTLVDSEKFPWNYEPSLKEKAYHLLHQGVLEDIPELLLGLVYTLSVTVVGISAENVVSLGLTFFSMFHEVSIVFFIHTLIY